MLILEEEASMHLKAAKLELFEHFARVGKAIGSRPRLLLLDLLAQGEKTVERLARQSGLTVGNTSAHLKALRQVSLVSPRREGAHVYYPACQPPRPRIRAFLADPCSRAIGGG